MNMNYQRRKITEMVNLIKLLTKKYAIHREQKIILQKNETMVRTMTHVFLYFAVITNVTSVVNLILGKYTYN